MIEAWNSVVGKTDVVYHLGDFSFGTKEMAESVFNQLNGYIHLINGNHDKVSKNLNFVSRRDYLELNYESSKLVLFHYPIDEWNGMHKDAIHFHGHVHSINGSTPYRTYYRKNMLDVGVENIGIAPIKMEDAIKRARQNG